jgi:hypothetical protein
MRNEPTPLSFDEFADELMEEQQPRAAVILAASKIDNLLRQTLASYLHPKTAKAKDPDELLDGDNPLSTFSSRIKMCSRLGIIDPDLGREFDRLRQIRNQAAHWVSFSVRESPIREQFQNLRAGVIGRKSYELSVSKFLQEPPVADLAQLKAVLLTLCVLAASVAADAAKNPGKAQIRKLD